MKRISFSNWRAVAHNIYGEQHLLYVGNSSDQVKKNYLNSFYELLSKDEQMAVNKITIEKWAGKPGSGGWGTLDNLRVPKVAAKKMA